MMNPNVLLIGINAKYIHSNPAVYSLKAYADKYYADRPDGCVVSIAEYTINQSTGSILSELYHRKPDVAAFSCYIWNIGEMLALASDLKSLLPNAKIVFGGPEVSFDIERFELDFIDHIVCGEGESAMLELCNSIRDGASAERVIRGERSDAMADEGILYRDGDFEGGTMLYYESSRGCPYGCAYCLSSASSGVRAKSVEQVLSDLRTFEKLDAPIKIIKFVDRTFNFNVSRANAVWRALLSDEFTKNYHFEICADLLNEESFDILSKFKKGKIQLEIGLQSTNEKTLSAVSRHLDAQRIISAAARIKKMGNVHVHLDLIAGLPYEDMASFKSSFDSAYFACDMLQLGFLKLLFGTELRRRADEYGYVASTRPPYTVLKSKWLSFEELARLGAIADVLDRYRESGGFDECLEYALCDVSSPFDFYSGLCDFIAERDGRSIRKISQNDAYALPYQYILATQTEKEEKFSILMHRDYAKKEVRRAPRFLKNKS